MSRSRRGGRRSRATAELNITVFMNLMVILVPFLLITAVFSRVAILELNLPGPSNDIEAPEGRTFRLEITVRAEGIEVGDRNAGVLGVYPKAEGRYDFDALGRKLSELKLSYPDKTDASILLEPDISYDTLVQVMDRVRVTETVTDSAIQRTQLFPDIAIGDAPAARDGV